MVISYYAGPYGLSCTPTQFCVLKKIIIHVAQHRTKSQNVVRKRVEKRSTVQALRKIFRNFIPANRCLEAAEVLNFQAKSGSDSKMFSTCFFSKQLRQPRSIKLRKVGTYKNKLTTIYLKARRQNQSKLFQNNQN